MSEGARRPAWYAAAIVLAVSCWAGCSLRRVDLLPGQEEKVAMGGAANDDGDGTLGAAAANGDPDPGVGAVGGRPTTEPVLALLVVDEVSYSFDAEIEAQLESRGIAVTQISELEVLPADALSFALVVVTPSADSADLGATLKGVEVPIMLLEPSVMGRHGLGAPRKSDTSDSVTIQAPEHPVVAGRTDVVQVCDSARAIDAFSLVDGVTTLATTVSGEGALSVVTAGTVVDDEVVPAPRVLLSLLKPSACRSADSWAFFHAGVDWLLAQ